MENFFVFGRVGIANITRVLRSSLTEGKIGAFEVNPQKCRTVGISLMRFFIDIEGVKQILLFGG